jgi:uncharacterized RDD family membrane protein YckC
MLCQRCSHPLPPLADRCIRCFALNPRDLGAALSIESDPPAPVTLQFSDDAPAAIAWHAPPPSTPAAAQTDRFASPAPKPVWTPAPAFSPPSSPFPSTATPNSSSTPNGTSILNATSTSPPNATSNATSTPNSASTARSRPPPAAQLLAWSVDLSLLLLCSAFHLAVASALLRATAGSADYGLDLLLRGPRLPALWAALGALLAVAYSWLFTTLGGRTPGLALAGLRVESLRGGALTITEALARATLAIPSAALGLAGFAVAFVDPRGQTLHDKLCGAVVVHG